jgi:metal-responsive CopG/Arc/MetJ family transcriptional regulator
MATITIDIPDQFLTVIDEVTQQSGAGTRDVWARNTIANFLINYELQKEFAAQMQARNQQLVAMWS